jgi:putative transposase
MKAGDVTDTLDLAL